MKPPIKRFTEGITYYSYGGPNATGASYKNISEDQDDCDADVVLTEANDHETADDRAALGESQGKGKNIWSAYKVKISNSHFSLENKIFIFNIRYPVYYLKNDTKAIICDTL